jgi:hypothetical protein
MTTVPDLARYAITAVLCWDLADHSAAGEFELSGYVTAVPGPDGRPSDSDIRAILREKAAPPDGYTGPPSVRGWTITGAGAAA